MRSRTFPVQFSEVLGADAHELEFGPDDHMVVRPLFTMPREASAGLSARMADVGRMAEAAANLPAGDPERIAAESALDQLVADIVDLAVVEWHLTAEDGTPIPKPSTPDALNALPTGLAAGLYPFLTAFRGRDPNRTSRS